MFKGGLFYHFLEIGSFCLQMTCSNLWIIDLLFSVCIHVCLNVSVCWWRKWPWIPRAWSYRLMCVLGSKPRSSAGVVHSLHCGAASPAPILTLYDSGIDSWVFVLLSCLTLCPFRSTYGLYMVYTDRATVWWADCKSWLLDSVGHLNRFR